MDSHDLLQWTPPSQNTKKTHMRQSPQNMSRVSRFLKMRVKTEHGEALKELQPLNR